MKSSIERFQRFHKWWHGKENSFTTVSIAVGIILFLFTTILVAPFHLYSEAVEAHTNDGTRLTIEALELRKELKDLQSDKVSHFQVSLGLDCWISTNYDGSATTVIFSAAVVNRGIPAVAWEWVCRATNVSGRTYTVFASQTPLSIVFDKGPRGETVGPLTPDNYFPSQVESVVPAGGAKRGWIAFNFPIALFEEVDRGTDFTVEVQDAYGNRSRSQLFRWIKR